VPGVLIELLRRDRAELAVERDVPRLPVEPRRVDQAQQVRAERDRAGDRGHRDREAQQGAAHRDAGPAATGVEREPHAGDGGQRHARRGEALREP
jgi:hypothetical protein